MYLRSTLIAILLFLVSSNYQPQLKAVREKNIDVQKKAVGGIDARENRTQFFALIHFGNERSCGGAFIAWSFVATTASCLTRWGRNCKT